MPNTHEDQPVSIDAETTVLIDTDDPTGPERAAEADPGERRRWLIPALVGASLIAVLGGTYLVDWLLTKDTLARGTEVGGVEVGGLSTAEALAKLESEFGVVEQPFVLTAHGVDLTLDPAEAGLALDLRASVEAAGTRSANPFTRIGALVGNTTELPVVTTVDAAALTAELNELAAASDVPAVEGDVSVDGTAVTVVEPVTGELLDVPVAADDVSGAWTSGDPRSVIGLALPATVDEVRASAQGVAAAADEVRTVLAGPLAVAGRGAVLTVQAETLAAATTVTPDAADGFTVSVDATKLRELLQPELAATEISPVDASLTIVNGAPQITPSVDGQTVDWTATSAALDAAVRSPERQLQVVYSVTPPARTTEAVQALGVKEVVAEFTTGGFASDSGQNVRRAAEEVNGAIVEPGETFSLNGHTGPRGLAQGYVEAGIIQNGVPDRAVGGGISQFATTLYNATFFAGMVDVEHKAHSYFISRYPAGREATVFQAVDGTSIIDVKFKNPHDTAVYIETFWTPSNITVRLWGTKTVDVESVAGERYKFTDPQSKTIPYGEECVASAGTRGFSIDVTRVIRDLAGAELSRQTQTTVYNGQMKITCEPPPAPPVEETPVPAPVPGG